MRAIAIENVKKGEFIKRIAYGSKVHIRGEYDRTTKRYRCDDWDDISRDIQLKKGTIVYVDFEF